MTFIKLARIFAYLILVVGAWNVVIGLIIATEFLLPYEQALARYAPGAPNSGAVIDRGIQRLIIAVGLGALAEIGYRLQKVGGEK